jgi:hypothetical protein
VRRLPVLLVRELVEQLHLLHQVARLVADQLVYAHNKYAFR